MIAPNPTTQPLPPWILLDLTEEDPVTKILTQIQGDDTEEVQRGILCNHCEHKITIPEELITIGDKFIHCFTNPAGVSFEIQCYRQASGATISGKPTEYFSWFKGYAWQYSYCEKCNSHLGWYFSREENGFYGLNVAALKGEI